MYSSVNEFLNDFQKESETTAKIFANLTDEALLQKVTPEGRNLAYIAWHIVITVGEMMNKSGLSVEAPSEDSDPPESAKEILESYNAVSKSLIAEIKSKWTDEMMNDDLEMYGEKWKRHVLCKALINHEIHHRGQLTVLMRQAGLKVPGTYGPSKEEWGQYGLPEAK